MQFLKSLIFIHLNKSTSVSQLFETVSLNESEEKREGLSAAQRQSLAAQWRYDHVLQSRQSSGHPASRSFSGL